MKVRLWDITNPILIAQAPTGITYTNQTGGVACLHPEIEGFLVPLPSKLHRSHFFEPDRWYGGEFDPTMETWNRIAEDFNATFNRGEYIRNFRIRPNPEPEWEDYTFRFTKEPFTYQINKRQDENSDEAWVFCTFELEVTGNFGEARQEWKEFNGVLTWENCD